MPRPALLLLFTLVAGCSGATTPDLGPGSDCGIPRTSLEVRTPEGEWRPVADAPRAELLLGFQGFKMVYARVHASATPAVRYGAVVIHLDGREPFSQSFPEFTPHDDGAGGVLSDEFPLFFNGDTLPFLANRGCTFTLRLGADACGALTAGKVTLIYRENCIHTNDGGIYCTDGGTPL